MLGTSYGPAARLNAKRAAVAYPWTEVRWADGEDALTTASGPVRTPQRLLWEHREAHPSPSRGQGWASAMYWCLAFVLKAEKSSTSWGSRKHFSYKEQHGGSPLKTGRILPLAMTLLGDLEGELGRVTEEMPTHWALPFHLLGWFLLFYLSSCLKTYFYVSVIVDIQYYISFRSTTEWLDTRTPYEVSVRGSLVPIWHHT